MRRTKRMARQTRSQFRWASSRILLAVCPSHTRAIPRVLFFCGQFLKAFLVGSPVMSQTPLQGAILPVPSSLRQVVVLGHGQSAFPCRALDRGRLSQRSVGSGCCRAGLARSASQRPCGIGHQARRCLRVAKVIAQRSVERSHERLFTFLSSTTVVHSRGSDAPDNKAAFFSQHGQRSEVSPIVGPNKSKCGAQ
jgi:hypothetical protein